MENIDPTKASPSADALDVPMLQMLEGVNFFNGTYIPPLGNFPAPWRPDLLQQQPYANVFPHQPMAGSYWPASQYYPYPAPSYYPPPHWPGGVVHPPMQMHLQAPATCEQFKGHPSLSCDKPMPSYDLAGSPQFPTESEVRY